MPNAPIEFILVRDRETGLTKYIPTALYESEKSLWAQVAGGKTVNAMQAPTYEPTATEGGSKSGQKAAPEKENS